MKKGGLGKGRHESCSDNECWISTLCSEQSCCCGDRRGKRRPSVSLGRCSSVCSAEIKSG